MYSTHKERKFIVAERFMKTLRIKFISMQVQYQNVYIDKLDDIVNKWYVPNWSEEVFVIKKNKKIKRNRKYCIVGISH